MDSEPIPDWVTSHEPEILSWIDPVEARLGCSCGWDAGESKASWWEHIESDETVRDPARDQQAKRAR